MNEIHNWAEEIVLKSLLQEIELEATPLLLFRTDSLATKLWSGFAKIEGRKYLECFFPLIKRAIKECAKGSIAFDSTKKEKEKEKEKEKFVELLDLFFKVAVDNYHKVDPSLKNILRAVSFAITQKFPEHPTGGLSSLFFLRFLCSAVSQPEAYELIPQASGLQQQITPVSRKTLVSASRALQNLANRIEFAQADILSFVNIYLRENFEQMSLFLKRMTWKDASEGEGNDHFPPLLPSLSLSTVHLPSTPGLSPPLSPHLSLSSQTHVAFTLPQAENYNLLSSIKEQEVEQVGGIIGDSPVEETLAEEEEKGNPKNSTFSFVPYTLPDISFTWPFSLSSLLLPLYAEDAEAQVTSSFQSFMPPSLPFPSHTPSPSTTPFVLSPLNSRPTSQAPSPLPSPHPVLSSKAEVNNKEWTLDEVSLTRAS